MSTTDVSSTTPTRTSRLRANSWPVVPMRVFLAALFGFAGYAKLTYPGFFSPTSPAGLKASIDSVKTGTPLGGALGPLSDHPSLFGHITAYAEIAIGLGLLVGLLTRLAALGGIVLTVMILLSIDWGGVKEYTASSGWFTSVDLAVAAALSVFVLGGAGPLSLDGLLVWRRQRANARDDAEPSFRDSEYEDSRRRLQGAAPDQPSGQFDGPSGQPNYQSADQHTQQLPTVGGAAADSRTDQSRPGRSEPKSDSLWNEGRRDAETPRQGADTPRQAE